MSTIAITMAGFGNRFRDAGYAGPKYQIDAYGRPLFDWAMLSLKSYVESGWRFSFALRKDDHATNFILGRCKALGMQVSQILELEHPTDGQATTGRMIADQTPKDEPFAVFNIDTFIRPESIRPSLISSNIHGWLPCFPGEGDCWSFVKIDEQGFATELAEKIRISNHASTGFYWFSSNRLYLECYSEYFKVEHPELKERYIAPMYNHLLAQKMKVRIQSLQVDEVGLLGTPDQLNHFLREAPVSARSFIF